MRLICLNIRKFMKKLPKIGITMRLESERQRFYLGRDYSEAVENFGAIPVHIGLIPKENFIYNILEDLDGILLPGSDNDIDPLIFGEEPIPQLGRVVPLKDKTDLLVLKKAEKLKLPILAICYGMQALNVFRGGTLFQDIETQIKNCVKHSQGFPLDRNSHSLEVTKESRLARLITKKDVKINSHHHQSIKEVGNNLKISGKAKDGVVECIEDKRKDRFVLGVQWHPELSWKTDKFSENIFKEFIKEASKYSKTRKN